MSKEQPTVGTPPSVGRPLLFDKTVRMAVSGDVRLTALEVAIIDSPDFQRLRRIQQLGPAQWVYPTALHTRFDHSIGVLATAELMIQSIRQAHSQIDASGSAAVKPCVITENQRVLARLFGLLHDITHVPYGHTLENELRVFDPHDAFDSTDGQSRFERFLGEGSTIGKLIQVHLGRAMYDRFRAVCLRGKTDRLEVSDDGDTTCDEFIYFLVSDTVCADLIDYTRRDCVFCNLEFRVPSRFLNFMYVADTNQPEGLRRRVVIRLWKPRTEAPRRDVITDLAELLNARYMLAERVYYHHTKIVVGTMIARAALEAKLNGRLTMSQMFEFGDATFLDYVLRLGSDQSQKTLDESERACLKLASDLARKVLHRELYETVKEYPRERFEDGGGNANARQRAQNLLTSAEDRRLHENEIANIAGAADGDVLLYIGEDKMNAKVAKAVVDWRGELTLLKSMNDETMQARLNAIAGAHERLWNVSLIVNPDLPAEQKELAQLAFEARFLPSTESQTRWETLLKRLAANDQGLSASGYRERDLACENAARELAKTPETFAAHGRTAKEALLDFVGAKLKK